MLCMSTSAPRQGISLQAGPAPVVGTYSAISRFWLTCGAPTALAAGSAVSTRILGPSVFVARRTLASSRSSAGKVSQQTAAADAQADAEADGRPPARPVDAVRGHLGQHGRRVVFRVQ